MLTSTDKVREIIGLSEVEAPDEELDNYIVKAQKKYRNDVAIWMRDDTLTGLIDSSNCTFNLTYKHIFDRNYDGNINSLDIDVYYWAQANSIDTRTTLSISTVNYEYGFVKTSTAPAKGDSVAITASYFFYPRDVDKDLESEAVATLAGYLYIKKEMLLIPDSTSHGAMRYSFSKPYNELYYDYLRLREGIIASPMITGTHPDVTLIRSEVS